MAKATVSKEEIQAKVWMNSIISFWLLLVVNVVVVLLGHSIFPMGIVFGTHSLSLTWSVILSMSLLTLLDVWGIGFVTFHEWRRGKMYDSKEWMLAYFVIDFVGIWVIARLASHLGFGVAHWWVALLLAIVLDMVQGMAMMASGKTLFMQV